MATAAPTASTTPTSTSTATPKATPKAAATLPKEAVGKEATTTLGSKETSYVQVNCQVSNDLKELQCLHDATGWTPGATHIRPTAETRALKEEYLNDALQSYATLTDFVLDTVFGLKTRQGSDGLFRADNSGDGDDDMEATKVLEDNKFPYSLPPGTRHSILWYLGDWRGVLDGDTITDHVSTELAEVIGGKAGATFEFVWYENPKMSIPDIFHVQVFWRELFEEEV